MNTKNRSRHQQLRRLHKPARNHAAALKKANARRIADLNNAAQTPTVNGLGRLLVGQMTEREGA